MERSLEAQVRLTAGALESPPSSQPHIPLPRSSWQGTVVLSLLTEGTQEITGDSGAVWLGKCPFLLLVWTGSPVV